MDRNERTSAVGNVPQDQMSQSRSLVFDRRRACSSDTLLFPAGDALLACSARLSCRSRRVSSGRRHPNAGSHPPRTSLDEIACRENYSLQTWGDHPTKRDAPSPSASLTIIRDRSLPGAGTDNFNN